MSGDVAGQVGKAMKPGADLSGIFSSSQQSTETFLQLMEESSSFSCERSQSPPKMEGSQLRIAPAIIFHYSPHFIFF